MNRSLTLTVAAAAILAGSILPGTTAIAHAGDTRETPIQVGAEHG